MRQPVAQKTMDHELNKDSQTQIGREARYGEFVSLLARHDHAIRRFVRSLMPSREGIDDVMQETALECWKKFSDFAPNQGTAPDPVAWPAKGHGKSHRQAASVGRSEKKHAPCAHDSESDSNSPDDSADEFIRWACVIARYKALSWQRDRSRDRLVFRESVVERLAEAAVERFDQPDAERQAVEACLGKMPNDQQRLILSVHSPGESVALIAAETGEKARRLYSRINVLRKLLLDCVQQQLAGEIGHG